MFINENPKYCLWGAGNLLVLNALSSQRVESNVRQIWEIDVYDIHEALLLTWFNSNPSMDNQSPGS